jgi:GNAT superfamily N-acetyltransferase
MSIDLVDAEGAILDQILADTFDIWHEGLNPAAYRRYYTAQRGTAWGRSRLHRSALVSGGGNVLASAKVYDLAASLDGRPVRVIGVGAVFTPPAQRGRGYARTLLDRLLQRAAGEGADLALLFSEIGPDYYARLGFSIVPRSDVTIRVIESDRRGAPATLVRAGEDSDLANLADMGRARAHPYRLHLDRDRDLIQFAIARKRLLAGLGPPGACEVHFFVAEEGAAAVAYVVISVRGTAWTIEEAGDRDPAGARLGAILQVLLARDPRETRPVLRGCLPNGFCPPQIRIVERSPANEVMMILPLTARGAPDRPLNEADVLHWHGDQF